MEAKPRWSRVAASAATLIALAAGCGSAPDKLDPTGVDELTIPTPDPDPADFVAGVDNPWLPLSPGSRWRYVDGSGATHLEVIVEDETRVIDQITCVEVRTVTGSETRDWYAQDRHGNVWYFGHDGADGSWAAGSDGAEAGLIMAASPRVGDGYRQGPADAATVISVDEQVETPAGSHDQVLVIESSQGLRHYVAGVGPVMIGTGDQVFELVASTQQDAGHPSG